MTVDELREVFKSELTLKCDPIQREITEIKVRLNHHSHNGCTFGQVTRSMINKRSVLISSVIALIPITISAVALLIKVL